MAAGIPLTEVGFKSRVIVDLHLSETFRDEQKKFRLIKRVYSVKDRSASKAWKLKGHSPRLILRSVDFIVSEAGRRSVLKKGSKTPHAYIQGTVEAYELTDDEHKSMIAKLLSDGGVYVAYDPYKVENFCITQTEHLPLSHDACEELERIDGASLVYAFETGVIAMPTNK